MFHGDLLTLNSGNQQESGWQRVPEAADLYLQCCKGESLYHSNVARMLVAYDENSENYVMFKPYGFVVT